MAVTSNSKRLPLYEQVAELVRRQIESGQFEPGQQLYSIREMCDHFDISDVTAKKALRALVHRKLIRTVNGVGAFVADRPTQAAGAAKITAAAGFIKIGLHSAPIFVYEMDLIQQELGRLGHPFIYAAVETMETAVETARQLVDSGAGSLVVFPSHNTNPDETLSAIVDLGRPMLVLESRWARGSYITADIERATMELADHLYDLGHRRICLATSYQRKVNGFNKAMTRWNDPKVKHWIIGEPGKTDTAAHDQANEILALSPRPTAVIVSDDHAASILISHFLQAGLRVPDDISVAGFDDHPSLSVASPVPVTTLRHPCREVAEEVGQWVKQSLLNPGTMLPRRREITGTLIQRDSTAPPSTDK